MISPSFFPEQVALALAEDWMWETPVLPSEEALLSGAAAGKRVREFRAGRHCAHQVLQQLGFADFALLRDRNGAPEWPESVCGSISHSGERCVVIGASRQHYRSIAVDIEKDRLIRDETLLRIAHPHEQQQLLEAPDCLQGHNLRAALFGMKECVHKIYYPLNRHTLDFLDVTLDFHWESMAFSVTVIHPAPSVTVDVRTLSGMFGFEAGYVYSRICLE
jgi:4'-phosphopantetheinyl transferase EntD